jgi:hypothetical protein
VVEPIPKARGSGQRQPWIQKGELPCAPTTRLPGAFTSPQLFHHRRDCHAEASSFFDVVPSGADAYLLKHVIHDWDDTRTAAVGLLGVRRPGC